METKPAPPTATMMLGMMMNTLDAGVTDDRVIKMLPRNVRLRDSFCSYRAVLPPAETGSIS